MSPIGLLIYAVHAVSRLRPARGNAFSPEVPSIRRFSLEASTREFCREFKGLALHLVLLR
jgi:hypothetical protein